MSLARRSIFILALTLLPQLVLPAHTAAREARVTARTLLRFLPRTLGGARAESREQADALLVHAAYRTPTGFINVNLALTRSVAFDAAQVRGAESDASETRSFAESRGVAVGRFRALYVAYTSGSETVLSLFLASRITVRVSVEGTHPPEAMVALALALDLEALDAVARRVPEPPPLDEAR